MIVIAQQSFKLDGVNKDHVATAINTISLEPRQTNHLTNE